MNPRDFVYWLQGMFEISEAGGVPIESLNKAQIEMIKKHLGYVFTHMQQESVTIPSSPGIDWSKFFPTGTPVPITPGKTVIC